MNILDPTLYPAPLNEADRKKLRQVNTIPPVYVWPAMTKRPSPHIQLLIHPPLAFEVFARLLKAIGKTMDDCDVPYEISSDYTVSNEGDIVTLLDTVGIAVMTYDLKNFRVAAVSKPLVIDRNRGAGVGPLAMDRVRSVDEGQQ